MHVFLAMFIATAFWSALPVKLVAIAGSAYVIIAMLKRIFPAIGGWQSMALNVALNVAGSLMVAKPADFSDVNFWAGLMLSIASAAGIHGTVKAAMGGSTPPDDKPATDPNLVPRDGPQMAIKSGVAMLLVLCMAMSLTGCLHTGSAATVPAPLPTGAVDQADATAYKTLRPAHDFAAHISADVQSGKLKLTATQVLAVTSLNRLLNVADQAEQSYHAAGGGNQAALNTAVAAVLQSWSEAQSALAQAISQ